MATEREIVLDVSSHQIDRTNPMTAADYKKIGAKHNIIKVSEGTTYTNPYIKKQIEDSVAGGVKDFAYYHYSRFTTDSVAVLEADYFMKQAKAKANIQPGDLLTDDAEISNMTTSSHVAFLKRIKAAGYKTGFYTYKYMLSQFDMKQIMKYTDFFWLAAYPLANSKAADKNPDFNYFPSADSVDLWQYTDNLLGYNVDASISVTENCLKLFTSQHLTSTSTTTTSKKNYTVDALGDKWYSEKGTFTTSQRLNLRWGAKDKSSVIATLPVGSVVKYEAYSDHDGYRWLKQKRADGNYGYLPCKNLKSGKVFGKFN